MGSSGGHYSVEARNPHSTEGTADIKKSDSRMRCKSIRGPVALYVAFYSPLACDRTGNMGSVSIDVIIVVDIRYVLSNFASVWIE
mmetsp:Transcript_6132/g.14134  ORF Transcript_6132/g.14134 Transcript_6132/m.14134 type:complete len:85 (+) Transcript_6132:1203-1457(+)